VLEIYLYKKQLIAKTKIIIVEINNLEIANRITTITKIE